MHHDILTTAPSDPSLDARVVRVEPEPSVLPRRRTGPPAPSTADPGQDLPRASSLRYVPPVLAPLRLHGAAWVAGRGAIVLAFAGLATTVGDSAARPVDAAAFWERVAVLAVPVVMGLAATVNWSAAMTGDARRLRLVTMRPSRLAALWLLPVAWIAIGTALMRIDVRAEVDPMPGVAVVGLAVTLGVPYLATSTVMRTLDRRRPPTGWWWTMFVLEVVAFGAIWNVLSGWSAGPSASPRGPDWWLRSTWTAVVATSVAVLITLFLAVRAPRMVRDRIRVLEQRVSMIDGPAWFRTGFEPLPADTEPTRRPMLAAAGCRRAALVAHFVWAATATAVAVVAVGAVATGAEPERELVTDLAIATTAAAAVYVTAHGVWSTVAGLNARRASIMSVAPSVPIALAAPAPLVGGVVLLADGESRWPVLTGGLVVMLLAFVVSTRVLAAVIGELGGAPGPFRAWSLVAAVAAAASVVAWLHLGPLGEAPVDPTALAVVATIQALVVLVAIVPAAHAMRTFDDDLRAFRRW